MLSHIRFPALFAAVLAALAAVPAQTALAQSNDVFEIKRGDDTLPPLDEYDNIPKGMMLSEEERKEDAVASAEENNSLTTADGKIKIAYNYENALKKYKAGEIQDIMTSLEALASNGHHGAEELLGVIYRMGQGGIEKHENRAFKLLSKAAESDRPLAQHHLGIMYFLGEAVNKDPVQALKWISIAIIYYPDGPEKVQARQDRESILTNMSRRERENAHIQAREFLEKRGVAHLLDIR